MSWISGFNNLIGLKKQIKMRIILQNKFESADQLSLFLKELGTKYNVPKNIISEIDLALGELIINIIKYAYREKQNSFISLDCQMEDDKIVLLLKDKGKAFNPLKYKSENQDSSLEDRLVGGLGIMIAKNSMDSISYERKEDENLLKLIKFIGKNKA